MMTRFEPNERQRAIIEQAQMEVDKARLIQHHASDEVVNRMTVESESTSSVSGDLGATDGAMDAHGWQWRCSDWMRFLRLWHLKARRQLRRLCRP